MSKEKRIFEGVARKVGRKQQEIDIENIEQVINPKARIVKFKNGETRPLTDNEINALIKKHIKSSIITPSAFMLRLQSMLQSQKLTLNWQHKRRMSFSGKLDPLKIGEKDEVVERFARSGYPKERIDKVYEKVEAEQKEIEKQKAVKRAESEKREKEMQKFPNLFMRLCKYISIKSYEKELAQEAKKASLNELQEARSHLLQWEKPDISDQQRTNALTWLNALIQNRQSEKSSNQIGNESAKSTLEKVVEIFRGQ